LAETPAVPLTIEGSTMLHQIFRFNWKAWRALSAAEQQRISTAATAKLKEIAEASGRSHRINPLSFRSSATRAT
jgi:peroxiredoxin